MTDTAPLLDIANLRVAFHTPTGVLWADTVPTAASSAVAIQVFMGCLQQGLKSKRL